MNDTIRTNTGVIRGTYVPANNVVSNSNTSIDNSIVRYDGTTGLNIQNSSAKIDDTGKIECNSIKVGSLEFPTVDNSISGQAIITDGSNNLSFASVPTITGIDNSIVRINGTDQIQDSLLNIDDSGNLTGSNNINTVSINTDTINEKTLNNGVLIDGTKIKLDPFDGVSGPYGKIIFPNGSQIITDGSEEDIQIKAVTQCKYITDGGPHTFRDGATFLMSLDNGTGLISYKPIYVDTINERTPNNGVSIDTTLIKDQIISNLDQIQLDQISFNPLTFTPSQISLRGSTSNSGITFSSGGPSNPNFSGITLIHSNSATAGALPNLASAQWNNGVDPVQRRMFFTSDFTQFVSRTGSIPTINLLRTANETFLDTPPDTGISCVPSGTGVNIGIRQKGVEKILFNDDGTIQIDPTNSTPVQVGGTLRVFNKIDTNQIQEYDINQGVTVDGCLIKDGGAGAVKVLTASNPTNYLLMAESNVGAGVQIKAGASVVYDPTTTSLRTGRFLTNEISPPGNPEFSFVGDPDTGLKWANTDTLFLQCGGNPIIQADNSAFWIYRPIIASGGGVLYNGVGLDAPINVGFFNQTADKTLTAPLGVLTTVIGAGVGSLTTPPNSLQVGSGFNIQHNGIFLNGGNQTWEIDFQVNGVSILGGFRTLTANIGVNTMYDLEIEFTIRSIGVSGSFIFNGIFNYLDSANVAGVSLANTTATTINTTIANTIDILMRPQTGGTSLTSQITRINKFY